MAYDLTLTDITTTDTFADPQIPVSTTPIEISREIEVLSGSVYTDYVSQKRTWTVTFKFMDIATYTSLKGFYDRQFSLFQYPLLTITDDNAVDIPVKMTINSQQIIDNCGTVQDVTVSFRESEQLDSPGS